MNKTLNFDKFLSEKQHDKIEVTIYGKVYEVQSFVPAIVPVMMARAETSTDPQAAVKMVMIAADSMIGQKSVNELCSKGMSADELADLVKRLFAIVNGTAEEDDESEEVTDEDSRKVKAGRAKK